MSRSKKPSHTHPGHPINTPRHPFDHRHRRVRDQQGGAPATVWAPPPSAVGPVWEAWLHASIRAAFLPPAGRTLDLTEQPRHPSPAAAEADRQREAMQDAVVLNRTEPASHTTDIDVVDDGADLVFVDLRDSHIDDRDAHRNAHRDGHRVDHSVEDRIGMLGHRTLRRGGILTVLTRCHTPRLATAPMPTAAVGEVGELVDPTGPIVASAQNADLLYLQHIVIPTGPLFPPENTLSTTAAGPLPDDRSDGEQATRETRPVLDGRLLDGGHEVRHVDLLVFLSPRSPVPARRDLGSPPSSPRSSPPSADLLLTSVSGPARGAR